MVERGNDTDPNKRRMGGGVEPYPLSKRRMLSIKDVPNLVAEEGSGILAIPGRLDKEIKKIIIQRKQDERGKNREVCNVQILERMVCGCKNQMITLREGGLVKLQQGVNQAERQKLEYKRNLFLKNVWGCMQSQITESARIMGTFKSGC